VSDRASTLPEALPPESRPVGQLVAESIRLYGRRFWPSLALGLSLAVVNQLSAGHRPGVQVVVLALGAPLLTASYIGACALAYPEAPRRGWTALAAGTLVFVPAAFLQLLYVLPAVAWLAFFGFVVPAAAVEGAGLRESFQRSLALARADVVHALGGLATFVLVFGLTKGVLILLLRGQGDATDRIALFLADLVLSPLLFLGPALLYADQAARSKLRA
jgi:hypothetical protein